MTNERKETVQYITAIGFLCTGIIMCFIAFFLDDYDIANGPLFYLGTAVTFCGAVFGINLMIQNQVLHAEARINKRVDKRIEEEERKMHNVVEEETIDPEWIDPVANEDM